MNSDTQPVRSGYFHNTSVASLAQESVAHYLRTGCAPVIVLSQAMTRDPKSALNTVALHLFNRGLIGGVQIHTFSLLVLLSSGKTREEILTEIFRRASGNDGLIFLEDAYRYSYDRGRAVELLDRLALMYQYRDIRCPLVLKAPEPFDRNLLQSCPNLYANCLHLAAEPVTIASAQPQYSPKQHGKAQTTPLREVREEPLRQAGGSQVNTHTAPRTEPRTSAGNQKSPQKNFCTQRKRNVFWYKEDPKLYEQELHGLDNYCSSRRLACTIKPTILHSGRLAVDVHLNIRELGNSKILIVYDHSFSREDRNAVRVAMSSGDNAQLRARLSLVEHGFDQELNGHLFNPHRSSDKQIFNSAGATAMDAIIRALI